MLIKVLLIFTSINTVFLQELLSNSRCNHYPERGTCERNFEVKWYYDRFDHRCRRFYYGGCDGNDNRFDTLSECEKECHFDPQIEETSSRRCFQKHDPGHCYGNFERWYFDSTLGRCICSWWSGCGGNSNRFYSYPHCMSVCGEHTTDKASNEYQEPPEQTVYESPLSRISKPAQPTALPPVPHQPAVVARPVETQPLGGGPLYPEHVMVPVHPPIYDDPDLVRIDPVNLPELKQRDEEYDDEEYEEDMDELPEEPDPPMIINNPQEWSAKTATRFFPHLVKPLPKFPDKEPPKEAYDAIVEGGDNSKENPESTDPKDLLFNLTPPDGFDEVLVDTPKSKKRETSKPSEVIETDFRTHRRRSASDKKEEYETTFHKPPEDKRSRRENYETPYVRGSNRDNIRVPVPSLSRKPSDSAYSLANPPNRPSSDSSGKKTFYNEFAETPFIRHTYLNPPLFPGYPILRGLDEEGRRIIPQAVSQDLINQLIQQHLALRQKQTDQQLDAKSEIVETPYRRIPGANGNPSTLLVKTPHSISYEEKRRRWKEKMKKKLRGNKIPPRPIVPLDGKKYYVTYSPYYRLYQISRDAPSGFWKNQSNPLLVQPKNAPTTTTTTTTTTTSAPPPEVRTTKKPLSIALEAEELPMSNKKQSIRISAVKDSPTSKPKHLIYLDEYDESEPWEAEEGDDDDDEGDERDLEAKTEEKTSPENPPPSNPSRDGYNPIVYPMNQQTSPPLHPTNPPPIQRTTTPPKATDPPQNSDKDFMMPKEDNEDYFDYGQSDEDLFFWKPGYDPRRHDDDLSRIKPESDAFEITVHQPEDKKL